MASHVERLPVDAFFEILARLPAKQISKFKCSNKTLFDTTSNRHFFVTQSRHAKADSGFFVQERGNESSFNLMFLDDCSGMPYQSIEFLKESGKVLSSSNGLVSYVINDGPLLGLLLYNPVRETCLPIPCPDDINLHNGGVGIGITFDKHPLHGINYEIICLAVGKEWNDPMICKIYSSRERKWRGTKRIHVGGRKMDFKHPIICNGIIYIASDCGPYLTTDSYYYNPYIIAFDIEKECSMKLSVPEDVQVGWEDEIEIAASLDEESICLIHCKKLSMFVIWVMKNKGENASWIKTHEVSFMSMGIENRPVHSFTVLNGSLLVFTIEDNIYTYNLAVGELKEMGEHEQGWYPSLRGYANTLRPCGGFEMKIIKL